MTASLRASFASQCPRPGIMYSPVYPRLILLPKWSAELRTNMALKLTRNLSQWHIVPRRPMGNCMNTHTHITLVIPTVRTVTNRDTGLRDVGQKGVEPKVKDRAKRRDKRRRATRRIRKKKGGRIARIRRKKMT